MSKQDEELVDLNSTEWWKQNQHRVLIGARLKANLTQEQLAERTGFSLDVIKNWEAGKIGISVTDAHILAEALDTYPEKFSSKQSKA